MSRSYPAASFNRSRSNLQRVGPVLSTRQVRVADHPCKLQLAFSRPRCLAQTPDPDTCTGAHNNSKIDEKRKSRLINWGKGSETPGFRGASGPLQTNCPCPRSSTLLASLLAGEWLCAAKMSTRRSRILELESWYKR